MRVEQVLRLLPKIEPIAPLRALVVGVSRTPDRHRWASAEPYVTLAKRDVSAAELREQQPRVLAELTRHLVAVYDAAIDAIDCHERGDVGAAVEALVRAGGVEEAKIGRAHV